MLGVYATLSLRYLRRRWFRALLIVVSIAAGVGMLVGTRALNEAMEKAAASTANPMAGVADLLVGNGDFPVDADIAEELRNVPGVQSAMPRIFESIRLPELGNRPVLLIGLNLFAEKESGTTTRWQVQLAPDLLDRGRKAMRDKLPPALVGKRLDDALPAGTEDILVKGAAAKEPVQVRRISAISAGGAAAALGGDVVILNLDAAGKVVGLKDGKVTRIDVALSPGADRAAVQQEVTRVLAGRAEARTPDEQNYSVQNAMASMQVGLLLCGVAALVVGLFLVYNALSVSVAERRHEIGILRGIGATRGQIRRLFAGEAALLGLVGSLLGIPLGIGIAHFGLQPMQDVVSDIFYTLDGAVVEVSWGLIALALAAGVLTAVGAALVPAVLGSRERPAEAVRRIPVQPSWRHRALQGCSSGMLIFAGLASIAARDVLPPRLGMYAGLGLVLIGALLATPLLTALLARAVQPLARRFLGIEGRLAADNLVRAPGRTGLVIAALAAGVALVMQTVGVIRSNRIALREWVQDTIGADLIVSSGSPVSAGGQSRPMDDALGRKFAALPGVEAALPIRMRKQLFRDTQIFLTILDAGDFYEIDSKRKPDVLGLDLYRTMRAQPDAVIASENFSILHGIHKGDTLTLPSPGGPVTLRVIGNVVDYSWNHGSLVMNRNFYRAHWDDDRVDVFDIYVKSGADAAAVQKELLERHGVENGLVALSRGQLQGQIDDVVERLYGIAIGQQVVVMFVAALGVVMALLISVLQRRRELGLLRAIGATRSQVLRCVVAEASLMGLIGTLIGLAVGIPLQWYALRVVILEETGYSFPVHVPWLESVLIAAVALLTARLAGLGPALYAVRQRIPEAIALE